MNFNSENIELFLTVLDTGSFSAAARKLNRVPSAVSMAIANIEAELGYHLFERTHRKVIPTAAALALEPQARIIAEQLRLLATHAYELSLGLESKLKIGVVSDANTELLFKAIKQLAEKFPLLNLEIITAPQDDILNLLYTENISLCLAGSNLNIKMRESLQLVMTETVIATISAHHPFLKEQNKLNTIEELINIRQIVVASSELDMEDSRSIIGAMYWKTNSLQTAINMVEAGLGWGNFPLSLVKEKIEQGHLVQLDFKNTKNHLPLSIYLIWLQDKPLSKAARELVQIVQANLSQNFH
ncbi:MULTISPECIES: LysR family transcriptional regulator [Acinetobacter]|uniref:LysR family transcriptional regulator n=8 Tax=Acinetobacter baumannii TaxID=470 RepID=A0A0D5YJJ5_ACIBA|nr:MULTISPECIES: LysR family transcriptional regulator [Acinetobacter]EMT96109.1 LysR family transcriptional regulator [Acinetobacter baumannii ABNIH6]EMU05543.1 LysR family transcriptional regulator [Acinetobacter baumannii ABNIH10]PXA51983.1 LysR family transcriptional regulator [Acinetobacter baumannii A424]ACJ41119.1 LysR family transcriptional regulator [Acinetobacter baumannii AB0057]AJF81552.1 LysR substrate binding domain protein [Acinetobacter baumannii]